MLASQRVLEGVSFAKGTGRCRPCKVLVGDGLSGAISVKLHHLRRPLGGRGMQRQKQEVKGQQMLKQKVEDQEVKEIKSGVQIWRS